MMTLRKETFKIEVHAFSIDWENYIRHYSFSYKPMNSIIPVQVICKNSEVKVVENFCIEENSENCSLSIYIIEPDMCNLSPLNLIVKVFRNDTLLDVQKFSRKWNEDTLTIDLTYDL